LNDERAPQLKASVMLLPSERGDIMQALKHVINRMSRKPEPEIVQVQLSDDGFEITWEEGRAEAMKWSDVDRVVTYKVDCFTYDMIWLAFERRGHNEALHIREETEGFQNLISALAKAFPEVNAEWYFYVMQPAFAENLTVLFERKREA
jgi:hypothetical protein